MATITVDPLTRIEGHLAIETDVVPWGTINRVRNAKCSGTSFRGFEIIIGGRDPRDAVHITQRICGVCPIAHGVVASMALESAFGITPINNGRLMRNLVLASNFIQSHILHFYHLSLVDYVDTTGILDGAPWTPSYVTPDMIEGQEAANLVAHYRQAFEYRRKAHQMAAIFGGKLPHSPALVPGGCSATPTPGDIATFRTLLADIRGFVDNVYLRDAYMLAQRFPAYFSIGRGYGNLISFGVFDLDNRGSRRLLRGGRFCNGQYDTVKPARILEHVRYSRYSSDTSRRNPANGQTVPDTAKNGAYSWSKAPRYENVPHEAGALARLWVNGNYRRGISVMDRIMARALEARTLAYAMEDWLRQLVPGVQGSVDVVVPDSATGIGMAEAPRGALGHWIEVSNKVVSRYQVITPTAWNASPRDDAGRRGPLEQALLGVPVADATRPVELLRVVHSFDPCLACCVH